MYATEKNHIDIVEALVNKGAKINIRDKYRRTALSMAKEKYNTEIVRLLTPQNNKYLAKYCCDIALPIIIGVGSYLLYNSRKINY